MFYKIEGGRYVAESDKPREGWYESAGIIDCTKYAPDTDGRPVLIPIPDHPAPYVPTLDEVKTTRKDYIKQRRNSEEAKSPFLFDSSLFDYDSLSRERINSAVLGSTIAAVSGVAPNTVVAEWKMYDNSTRNMTVADWLGFKGAEITRSGECFAIATSLKGAVESASDAQTVWGIDWPAPTYNWPTGNDSYAWNQA